MPQVHLVGVKGFEPPAPCSQSTCATRLRYTPLKERPAQATLIIIFKVCPVVNREMQKNLKFVLSRQKSKPEPTVVGSGSLVRI